jgi:hypothetical protein
MKFRGFNWTSRYVLVVGLLAVATVFSLTASRHKAPRPTVHMPAPPTVEAAEIDPYERAVALVEEEREQPTGRQADVEVPAQLKHYADQKRFLALQVAEARRLRLEVPSDFPALAELIRAGELVELHPYGENYVLYGVGLSAGSGPFTHYEERKRKSVPLLASGEELRAELARLDEEVGGLDAELAALRTTLKETAASDKAARKTLSEQIASKKKTADDLRKQRDLLTEHYDDEGAVRRFADEYGQVARLAADFEGETYALDNSAERREMKVRMLSYLRPAARDVLEEIGRVYREKFGRPLPVTSVVRTIEYQNRLSKTNPNATRIETPPHSTGLAFDIFYRYMDADEQQFLMAELARLKDAGRIEVLRERRDHFHVFVFADGRRPDESLVKQARTAASVDEGADVPTRPVSKRARDREAQKADDSRKKKTTARKNSDRKSSTKKTAASKASAKKVAGKTTARKGRGR